MNSMDVRFINPFLASVELVLRTMARMSVTPGKPRLKTMRAVGDRAFGVSALIELSGGVTGAVCMRFGPEFVASLVEAITGTSPRQIDADCLDALGEIANMVVGNAKKDFPIENTSIGTPKVGLADPLGEPPVLVMPFETAHGSFLVEARLKSNLT
jgi:chemotaxis protein CheX